jgi:hypothetical protein
MLESCDWPKVDIREDVAHPARHMQDVFEDDCVGFFATRLSANVEFDNSDASNRHFTLVGKGEDVGFEYSIGLEV